MSFGLIIPASSQMQGNMMHDSTHCLNMHKDMMHHGQMKDRLEKEMSYRKFGMRRPNEENSMAPVRQLMPYIMLVKKLPAMQQELALTDDQVSKLADLQATFEKQKADIKSDLIKKELKLKNLLKSNASPEEINKQLTACAASRINLAVAAYDTAGKMKSVLNDSQKKKLEEFIEKHHPMEKQFEE